MSGLSTVDRNDMPVIEKDTAAWWAGAADGVLFLERCGACHDIHFYPRAFCPACWSEDVSLVPAKGTGTVYSYSVVRVNTLAPFRERVPYVVAVIELDEGPRLMSNVLDVVPEDVRIGMAVQVRYRELSDGVHAPVFTAKGTR